MDRELQSALLKLLLLIVIVLVVVVIIRLRRLPLIENLGLKVPDGREFLKWLLWYIPIVIIGEIIYFSTEGYKNANVWDFAPLVMVVKALTIGIVGPMVEELIYRGLMFQRIAETRIGSIGALIATAIIFTAAHYRYDLSSILWVLVLGLYWGWVRYKTGSAIPTIVMHIIVNIIAVSEFIWINGRMQSGG